VPQLGVRLKRDCVPSFIQANPVLYGPRHHSYHLLIDNRLCRRRRPNMRLIYWAYRDISPISIFSLSFRIGNLHIGFSDITIAYQCKWSIGNMSLFYHTYSDFATPFWRYIGVTNIDIGKGSVDPPPTRARCYEVSHPLSLDKTSHPLHSPTH